MGGYIPLIRSRLFAFKIFLGLGVGVTYLIRRLFAFKVRGWGYMG